MYRLEGGRRRPSGDDAQRNLPYAQQTSLPSIPRSYSLCGPILRSPTVSCRGLVRNPRRIHVGDDKQSITMWQATSSGSGEQHPLGETSERTQ
ncbi:hypothetical protein VFPFJ_04064 [Purpureocillium lilacinum]|uniref:Uncharacterized protein n=1 Tax=Purpureocillium lilacinum TaxID=33203 RepID=A0A179HQQ2_PURLI|nr:hypothetical protein VFPFJ_04064 [Purpureocillium lilacinum]OAQ82285.1 hypothetical protein VFPBJ_04869 [Purpureocillium lilacinum]OAQ92324.1 hypothetical protein VFPFJ_04064 [Purpureocillium lilacinum]